MQGMSDLLAAMNTGSGFCRRSELHVILFWSTTVTGNFRWEVARYCVIGSGCRLLGGREFFCREFTTVADAIAAIVLGFIQRPVGQLDQIHCMLAKTGNHGGTAD